MKLSVGSFSILGSLLERFVFFFAEKSGTFWIPVGDD
jgi:hypothetical protein